MVNNVALRCLHMLISSRLVLGITGNEISITTEPAALEMAIKVGDVSF